MKEDKQSVNLQDLNLYSGLGLFTPDLINKKEEQTPMKRKKKKPKQSFIK